MGVKRATSKGRKTRAPRPARLGVLAWHFMPADKRLRYDGRRVKKGVTLHATGELSMCTNGMHASRRLMDALNIADVFDLYHVARVRLTGEMLWDDEKHCARERTPLTDYVDVRRELRKFAAWCSKRHGTGCRYARCKAVCAAMNAAFDARDRTDTARAYTRECAAQERELTRLVRKAIRERGR